MTIQQLQDKVLEGVELSENERNIFLVTISLKYLQELIVFLSVSGILTSDDILQTMTMLDGKIKAIPEETRSSLQLDKAIAQMQITTLGMVIGSLTADFSESDRKRIEQNIQNITEKDTNQ